MLRRGLGVTTPRRTQRSWRLLLLVMAAHGTGAAHRRRWEVELIAMARIQPGMAGAGRSG